MWFTKHVRIAFASQENLRVPPPFVKGSWWLIITFYKAGYFLEGGIAAASGCPLT